MNRGSLSKGSLRHLHRSTRRPRHIHVREPLRQKTCSGGNLLRRCVQQKKRTDHTIAKCILGRLHLGVLPSARHACSCVFVVLFFFEAMPSCITVAVRFLRVVVRTQQHKARIQKYSNPDIRGFVSVTRHDIQCPLSRNAKAFNDLRDHKKIYANEKRSLADTALAL